MTTQKQLEDEFDKLSQTDLTTMDFIKKISNQIIDEMIGEEKPEMNYDRKLTEGGGFPEPKNMGYNQKRDELIQFKKKFNQE